MQIEGKRCIHQTTIEIIFRQVSNLQEQGVFWSEFDYNIYTSLAQWEFQLL